MVHVITENLPIEGFTKPLSIVQEVLAIKYRLYSMDVHRNKLSTEYF